MAASPSRVQLSFLTKTKIVATVGPACDTHEGIKNLAIAGVNVFRLNFAHGKHSELARIVDIIRSVSEEIHKSLAILGDLSGPKIRLGELPGNEVYCELGSQYVFQKGESDDPACLPYTYEHLVDDLNVDDPVLLADGNVAMRVIEKPDDGGHVVCVVERPGVIRSRQGINLPGVKLRTPSLTEKDKKDLTWAIKQQLDFVGLSFVRSGKDIELLQDCIDDHHAHRPQIVAKIEKVEAIDDLDAILELTDAIMVARGDLGVEAGIVKVPTLQKQIIQKCAEYRVPVITATQMLESMIESNMPTRAEATDVANAVMDGTDAVMLSGETAVGSFPVETVKTMVEIVREAEKYVVRQPLMDIKTHERRRAFAVTEAVTLAAGTAANHLKADLVVVCTQSGRTAMSLSKQRRQVPILALTEKRQTARRMCLYWGVTPRRTDLVVENDPRHVLEFVIEWGVERNLLKSGCRIVLILDTQWSAEGHDLMMVHEMP